MSSPKVKKENVQWWKSCLVQYRGPVVFFWNALAFHQNCNWLPGVAVWLGINFTVRVLFMMNYSVLQAAGQVLVIFSLLYILTYFNARLTQTMLFPNWDPELEGRFHEICTYIAHGQEQVVWGVGIAEQVRRTTPWKFYCIGLAVAIVLIELGKWISTAILVQFLICLMLLLPLVMQYDLLRKENQALATHFLTETCNWFKRRIQGQTSSSLPHQNR